MMKLKKTTVLLALLGMVVPAGRSVTRLSPFRFRSRRTGCHFIVYRLNVL